MGYPTVLFDTKKGSPPDHRQSAAANRAGRPAGRNRRRATVPTAIDFFSLLKPGGRFGQYELGQRLGQGGCGEVFAARSTHTGDSVAIKFTLDERLSALSQAEGNTYLGLPSGIPGIAEFIAEGRREIAPDTMLHYLVIERIEGKSISDCIQTQSFSLPEILEIAATICSVLQIAAERGIFHKDIKPENVILRQSNNQPVLLDFGASTSSLNAFTPQYAPPEQINKNHCGAPSDIYSLGIMLFEMATGKLPTISHDEASLYREKLAGLDLSAAPDAIRPLLSKMTAVRPANRFQSYEELIQEIDALRSQVNALQTQVAAFHDILPSSLTPPTVVTRKRPPQ